VFPVIAAKQLSLSLAHFHVGDFSRRTMGNATFTIMIYEGFSRVGMSLVNTQYA
jgi:hypothetical protein